MRFTLNHLHGFYIAHPKPSSWFYEVHPQPSPWVLYGSPKTFIMGFIWFTRNLHHGFYDNPFRETKGFNICVIISINQSEFYVDYPHKATLKNIKQLTYLQLGITNIIYNLTNTDLILLTCWDNQQRYYYNPLCIGLCNDKVAMINSISLSWDSWNVKFVNTPMACDHFPKWNADHTGICEIYSQPKR